MLAVLMFAAAARLAAPQATVCAVPVAEEVCPEGGPYLLVYRFTVNVQEVEGGAPIYESRETFDGQRFPTLEAAYCGARKVRRHGVLLPVTPRFGIESNVMPETITPMLSLYAEKLGIHGVER